MIARKSETKTLGSGKWFENKKRRVKEKRKWRKKTEEINKG
jgi:hypothetical protein